jgi:hypothetical protein
MKSNGTAVYQRQHKRGLTLPQLNAVDLLVSGKTDKETAELLNLSRTCITKWRLYDPVFQAALNRRRAEVWSGAIDKLRGLIPLALDTLAAELENTRSRNRLKAASEILRLARLPAGALTDGPTDPEQIVRQIVEQRRHQARDPMDDLWDGQRGLPVLERHVEDVWRELELLAQNVDVPGDAKDGS